MNILDEITMEDIGFNYILNKIETITPYGNLEKKCIKPFKKNEKHQLIKEYKSIEKVKASFEENESIFNEIECFLYKIKNIKGTITRCENGEILDEVELFEIKSFAAICNELETLYKRLNIFIEDLCIKNLSEVLSLLDPENKKLPTFYIYETYSEKLKNIRELKRSIENKIIDSADYCEIEKLKEQRLNLVIQEQNEEKEIRINISKALLPYIKIIKDNIYFIGKLDFFIAKVKLGGVMPSIEVNEQISFKEAYNPKISDILESQGKKFTKLTIDLGKGTTILTGANMGGKSVTLKTVVLNLMLGMCGFYVFAEEASFPMLDFLFFISDDLQNVWSGLSTFGAEIIKVQEALSYVKEGTGFLALDEFARGTNPVEGKNLVKALVHFLNQWSSISFISTHYDGVVEKDMAHYQVLGLKNVDFNKLKNKIDLNSKDCVKIIQENMDYSIEKMKYNCEVPKDALNICHLLKLDESIIALAEKLYYNKESGDSHGE